jgi:hypothetical protein
MSSRLRKSPLLALLLLVVFAIGACGDSHTKVTTGTYAGESGQNAPYLDVGPLTYQVQISRELNPYDVSDAQYLQGVPPVYRGLLPGQEWFGVFIQVYNNTSSAHVASNNITIRDTQSNLYAPIVPARTNQFAYRGGVVPAGKRLPPLDTIAANGSTQGALLLFKIGIVSLDNRPLEVTIVDPTDASERASAELDV